MNKVSCMVSHAEYLRMFKTIDIKSLVNIYNNPGLADYLWLSMDLSDEDLVMLRLMFDNTIQLRVVISDV